MSLAAYIRASRGDSAPREGGSGRRLHVVVVARCCVDVRGVGTKTVGSTPQGGRRGKDLGGATSEESRRR